MGKRRWKRGNASRPPDLAPQAEVDRVLRLFDQVSDLDGWVGWEVGWGNHVVDNNGTLQNLANCVEMILAIEEDKADLAAGKYDGLGTKSLT